MSSSQPWIARKIGKEIYENEILAGAGSVTVIGIVAPGGAGKTYIARYMGSKLGSRDGYEPAHEPGQHAWSGILDVYDADVNSNPGLEARLIRAFGSDPSYFEEYDTERTYYESRMKTGVRDRELEMQRLKVEQAFGNGMVRAAGEARLVIALDTIERLQNAVDRIQQEIGFSNDTATVKGWLLSQIGRWSNCVVLLLGRPADGLWEEIQTYIETLNRDPSRSPIRFQIYTPDCLEADEAPKFFQHLVSQHEHLAEAFTPQLQAMLLEKTHGNPLLMDLAVEAMGRTERLGEVENALQKGDMERIKTQLIEIYAQSMDTEAQLLLRYLAAARRGLHADLLQALAPNDHARLVERLKQMGELPFIKLRPLSVPTRAGMAEHMVYFLHDEMYRLCGQALFRQPQELIEITRKILAWYEEMEKGSLADNKKVRQALQVESLYYRLRCDPEEGYKWYLKTVDEAVRSAEISFDILLTNELYQFLRSAFPQTEAQKLTSSPIDRQIVRPVYPYLQEWVDLDSATLWIKRFTTRGDRENAEKIGAAILDRRDDFSFPEKTQNDLSWGDLVVFYAQALMYSGKGDEALALYEQAIQSLEPGLGPEHYQQVERTFEMWRTDLVLGRAHNNIGYLYGLYRGRYKAALKEYQRAIKFFRASDVREELANTADNMGRIHAILGHRVQAETQIEDGADIRLKLNLPYRHALSLISLAIIHMNFHRPDLALSVADRAQNIVRTTGVLRGKGLAHIAVGKACRMLSEGWRQPGGSLETAKTYSQRSEVELTDAISIFEKRVHEPIQLIEANNELGCTYRARYEIYKNDPTVAGLADTVFSQAQIFLTRAIRLAEEKGNTIASSDTRQDVAELHFLACNWAQVNKWLNDSEATIPGDYKIVPGSGLKDIPEDDQVNEYYRLMGKIEMLRGSLAISRCGNERKDEDVIQATLHYLLASVYFNRFSRNYYELETSYRLMYNNLKKSRSPLVSRLMHQELDKWKVNYQLDEQPLASFYRDVFGLFDE